MIASLKRNWKGIVLLLISALSLAVGQLLWKFAEVGDIGEALAGGIPGLFRIFLRLLPGFIVYALGALVMTIGLGYGELSVLQPINSMSYVFALILSAIFLTEPISWVAVAGIFVTIAGVVIIGASEKK